MRARQHRIFGAFGAGDAAMIAPARLINPARYTCGCAVLPDPARRCGEWSAFRATCILHEAPVDWMSAVSPEARKAVGQ